MLLDAITVAAIQTADVTRPDLAAVTMADLRTYFDAKDHHPSADHWAALGDVVNTMAAMANGRASANVFLAALDPGVGKSTAVLAFATALMASPAHRKVGMIVCVGRVAEAATMARELAERCPGASLAVLTADAAANALSTVADHTAAQVLITTQQRIERATDGRDFASCPSFHFQGKPRMVRAWDEAWLPGITISLARSDLLAVVGTIQRHSVEAASAVEDLSQELRGVPNGAAVDVPDFEAIHGVSFHAILAGGIRDDQRVIIAALAALCGKTARVQHNGPLGAAVLTYKDTLPDDLVPLLVLDASGRVRETYRMIEQHRGGLVRLREAVKDYSPLRVHVWQRPGSKSAWTQDADAMVAGIAETILERPGEAWLVVAHKASGKLRDVGKAIHRKLPAAAAANVQAITWGHHMASNLYADYPNVILAGTLFMPNSHYTALTHMAQDLPVAPGLASKEAVDRTTHGEHANLVLQALCRGRVRKSDGDKCLPMNAYVIATKLSGIPGMLQTVFPRCDVRPWRETIAKVPSTVSRALRFTERRVQGGDGDVSIADVVSHLGIDSRNFSKLVTSHRAWQDGLAKAGLEQYPSRGRRGGGVRIIGRV